MYIVWKLVYEKLHNVWKLVLERSWMRKNPISISERLWDSEDNFENLTPPPQKKKNAKNRLVI